jgi:hypothetical protein
MKGETMEKPAKVEVGQRWRTLHGKGKLEGEIVSIHNGRAEFKWTPLDDSRAPGNTFWGVSYWAEWDLAYLGSGPSTTEGVAVRAGQRRRWTGSYRTSSPFVVVSVDDECSQLQYDDDPPGKLCNGGASNHLAKHTALIADSPLAEPAPPVYTGIDWGKDVPVKREVSTNGRDWTLYDSLVDADPFPAYRHRRENGVVAAVVETLAIRIVGEYGGGTECSVIANGKPCGKDAARGICEMHISHEMLRGDLARQIASDRPALASLRTPQSHATLFGGIWRLR